jgi:hypothetical protein
LSRKVPLSVASLHVRPAAGKSVMEATVFGCEICGVLVEVGLWSSGAHGGGIRTWLPGPGPPQDLENIPRRRGFQDLESLRRCRTWTPGPVKLPRKRKKHKHATAGFWIERPCQNRYTHFLSGCRKARTNLRPATSVSDRAASGPARSKK